MHLVSGEKKKLSVGERKTQCGSDIYRPSHPVQLG